jgi:hypothetical protein
VTSDLVRNGYLVSFNVPVWTEVYDFMNCSAVANIGISMFDTLATNGREVISRREVAKVQSLEDMKKFSRYNNFRNDPDRRGDPLITIAARGDLANCSEIAECEPLLGALDAKCVSASEAWTKGAIHAVNSPTTGDNLPPFQFSQIPFTNVSHDGLPDKWEGIPWIVFDGGHESRCAKYKAKNECTGEAFCGWCGDKDVCMPGLGTGPLFGALCAGGWSVNHINWAALGGWVGGIGSLIVILGGVLVYFKVHHVALEPATFVSLEPRY